MGQRALNGPKAPASQPSWTWARARASGAIQGQETDLSLEKRRPNLPAAAWRSSSRSWSARRSRVARAYGRNAPTNDAGKGNGSGSDQQSRARGSRCVGPGECGMDGKNGWASIRMACPVGLRRHGRRRWQGTVISIFAPADAAMIGCRGRPPPAHETGADSWRPASGRRAESSAAKTRCPYRSGYRSVPLSSSTRKFSCSPAGVWSSKAESVRKRLVADAQPQGVLAVEAGKADAAPGARRVMVCTMNSARLWVWW